MCVCLSLSLSLSHSSQLPTTARQKRRAAAAPSRLFFCCFCCWPSAAIQKQVKTGGTFIVLLRGPSEQLTHPHGRGRLEAAATQQNKTRRTHAFMYSLTHSLTHSLTRRATKQTWGADCLFSRRCYRAKNAQASHNWAYSPTYGLANWSYLG